MNIARSSLLLVLVNLLPVVGVVWLDWSVLEIMLLYWTESVIIGAVNVLRMLSSRSVSRLHIARSSVGSADERSSGLASSRIGLKLFLIPFFAMHFGMFCFGHLMAIVFIFSGDTERISLEVLPPPSDTLFWLAAAAILLSHLFSYVVNFIGQGEYRRVALPQLMRQPYGRIVVMHITVIVGGALIDWLESPVPMLVFLVAVKTVVDLRMHRRERRRFDDADATQLSTVPS